MANSIIMLGGRRAGKSTILASIIDQLSEKSESDICTFDEVLDSDVDGLYMRTRELAGIMEKRRPPMSEFLVDMGANKDAQEYKLRCSLPNAGNVVFTFYDVPGETMAPPKKDKFEGGEDNESYKRLVANHQALKTKISESEVFVIAIDTPFLMGKSKILNKIYNRIDEIKNLLINNINYNPDISLDKKLILFCPVKCEKWLHEGRIAEVNAKLRSCYKSLIDKCITNPAIEMYILPIETAGNLEFTALRDAMYLLRNEKENERPEKCSYDEETEQIFLSNGKRLRYKDSYTLEVDNSGFHFIDGNHIPYAWYKTVNDATFAPHNCEQVAYYLLRFLVKKEIDIRTEEHKASSIWKKFWERCAFWRPSFEKQLSDFEQMIKKLEDRRMIKEEVEGICKIK